MPKREDETWLNIHPHPPTCNCDKCTKERSLRVGEQDYSSCGYPTVECPICGCQSVFYNGKKSQYECLNTKCNAKGKTLGEIRRIDKL